MSSTSPIGLRSPARRARGYLLKGAGQEQIRRAVHAAGDGEAISGGRLATRAGTRSPAATP